jgi:hypothetical protein
MCHWLPRLKFTVKLENFADRTGGRNKIFRDNIGSKIKDFTENDLLQSVQKNFL